MSDYINKTAPEIMCWLDSVRCKNMPWGRWKYNRHMERDFGAISSGYAIWILSILDEIKNIPDSDRNQAIVFFQSCQDPKTGLFMDPLVTESDMKGNGHTWEDVKVQMTDIKYGLDYLGARPKYELPEKRFTDLSKVDIEHWVLSLDWKNPWLAGWQWDQCILAFYDSKNGISQEDKDRRIDIAFETFEKNIMDEKTGLPTKAGCNDISVGMAGLFKVLSIYNKLTKKIPYGEQAIDSVLRLQKPNGEFGKGADMCINWDSVWVLREIDKRLKGSYRQKDIALAMKRLADCLLNEYQQEDNGFAFKRNHCLEYHMSVHISGPFPEGDMVGTLQSLFCLQYADEYNSSKITALSANSGY